MAVILIMAAFTVANTSPATAQERSRTQSYWQFAASGRLDTIITDDVDGDSIEEIIVLDENGRLTLLSADGQQQWEYASPSPVTALGTLGMQNGDKSIRNIVLAGNDDLSLLDHSGKELWRVPIPITSAPLQVESFDYLQDGVEDIVLLLGSGYLLAFNARGENIWQFAGQDDPTAVVNPQLVVDDFDGDEQNEIVLGLFTARRFSSRLSRAVLPILPKCRSARRATASLWEPILGNWISIRPTAICSGIARLIVQLPVWRQSP